MGAPKSIEAYGDARQVLDKALEAEKGLKLTFPDYDKAKRFRNRCYTLRIRERARNARIFEDLAHPMHGKSAWDSLQLTVEDNHVKIVKSDDPAALDGIIIEEL